MVLATVLALTAAVVHAGWNLLLKTAPSEDRDITSWALYLVGSAVALPLAVLLGGPGVAAAPWLALSGCIHVGYITYLVAAYHHGDFSLAYPLARGGGALLAALGGVVLLGDDLPALAWVAIAVVAASLVSLVGNGVSRPTVQDALLTAVFIGTYTVIDGHGARVSADATAYGLATMPSAAVPLSIAFLVRRRGPALREGWAGHRARWVAGGLAITLAYTLVVVAMRHAPVGYVSVLRESSVVVGAFVGWRVLKEPLGGRRLISSLVMLVGLVGLVVASL